MTVLLNQTKEETSFCHIDNRRRQQRMRHTHTHLLSTARCTQFVDSNRLDLLQFRFRDGDTIDVLADALDDLRSTLHGVRAMHFTGDSRDIILYAANLFGSSKQRKWFFVVFLVDKS